MQTFTLSNKAKNDLRDIARYTEKKWGRTQRNLYLKQFDDVFRLLAQAPLSGHACDYIKVGYRKFPQGSHLLFYKITKNKIEIMRILHKNMDVKKRLKPN